MDQKGVSLLIFRTVYYLVKGEVFIVLSQSKSMSQKR